MSSPVSVNDRHLAHQDSSHSHMDPVKKENMCPIKSYAGFSLPGHGVDGVRKTNQDSLIMIEDTRTLALVFGCLDGHGTHGHLISQYLKASIEKNLISHSAFRSKDFKTAISETIHNAEMELLGNDDINTELSGTTMVLVVICNSKMIIANIGDSRAVLGRSSQLNGLVDQELALSIDHKPCSPFERYRITSMGGRVFPIRYSDGIVGPERVWLGNRNSPGLAMSRSLCDTVAHEAGVISTPDIFERAIDAPSDRVLILATDGLWDVMTNMEVTSLCAAKSEPSAAVSALIKEARTRWFSKSAFMDDTTVCVVFFHGSVPAI